MTEIKKTPTPKKKTPVPVKKKVGRPPGRPPKKLSLEDFLRKSSAGKKCEICGVGGHSVFQYKTKCGHHTWLCDACHKSCKVALELCDACDTKQNAKLLASLEALGFA